MFQSRPQAKLEAFPSVFLIIFVIFATEETWFASNFHIDMVLCEH